MAIYDAGTASLAANGTVTGVGTTWQAPLTLIRVGATIVFKTEPVKIYTISEIVSDTQINVYNPNSETVPAGTGYAILAHDGITVQGLAQDVAETLRYYQSRESEVATAVDVFKDFDQDKFSSDVNQVNTQHGEIVNIGAQVSANASQVSADKDAAAASAASASDDKDAAAASAQQAADYAASLDTQNLLRKDLNFSDVADKALAASNLGVYSTSQLSGSGDSLGANLLGYKAQVANSVAITQQVKNGERVSVFDFGAKADGSFDNASAFDTMVAAAESGVVVFFPAGVYKTSRPIRFTRPVQIYFDLGVRIQLTTSGHDFIVEMDFRTEDQGYWANKPFFGGARFILDGLGNARRGLSLRGVISGNFPNLQVTNVTQTGLYLAWTQCCTYENYICSNNVEVFTTKPEYGVIVNKDDNALNPRGTSCDIWVNPCIEHVSADGFYAPAMINSVILNGTIEGNGGAGLVLGHPTDSTYSALGNTVVGVDFEVNGSGDIIINEYSAMNDFIGLKSGYGSPSVQIRGFRNTFIGGAVSDFDFRPTSHDNRAQDVTLLAQTPVVNDEGVKNTYERLWNFADAKPNFSTNPVNVRSGLSGSSVEINPYFASYFVITATGTPINITSSSRKLDGAKVDLTIHNHSGSDSLVLNWSDDFRMGGFTPPKAGMQKGLSMRYDSVYGHWYCVGVSFESASY